MKGYSLIFTLLVFIGAIIFAKPLVVRSDPPYTSESIETYRKGDVALKCFDETESMPVPNH